MTARPRILVTRPLPVPVIAALKNACDVTMRDTNTALGARDVTRALGEFDAILPTLGDALDADAIASADPCRCRLIANFGVGYNHIDLAAARARGITVTNTPGAVTDATADIAIALMLMVARRAGEGERLVRSGAW
ncbi:MAG: D-glycerate dehydrogenase, partial [Paracoccaceae bacterium]